MIRAKRRQREARGTREIRRQPYILPKAPLQQAPLAARQTQRAVSQGSEQLGAQDPPTSSGWPLVAIDCSVQSRCAWASSRLAAWAFCVGAASFLPSPPPCLCIPHLCFHPHQRSLSPHHRHVALKFKARGGWGRKRSRSSFAGKMTRVVLEVDVNGEELFFVDKDVLARFCGRIRRLVVATAASARRNPRVALHYFPGGPEAFELVARFCYADGGRGVVTAANACVLRCAAEFLDMAADAPAPAPSLVRMAAKALEEMPHWPWHTVVEAVKQCQRLLPLADSTGAFNAAVAALVSQVAVPPPAGDATPTGSSPESSAFRFSVDTKSSSLSLRGSCISRTWWFEDLVALGPGTVERVATALVAKGTDHGVVARFLFYYLKCRIAGASAEDKKAMLEAAVAAMSGLDRSAVSCKGLFGILRIAAPLKLADACQDRLVAMIGRKLDHATLDNLLVPAPPGTCSLYDVSLVLRFLAAFLRGGASDEPARLKKAGRLIDLYLAEVAPDPSLRPAKFLELATALPAPARDCHDALYRAIDVYFQVHGRLTDEEKMKICRGLSYEKLSPECCKHLARNGDFPTRAAVQALASQHTVLKSIVLRDPGQLNPVPPSTPPPSTGKRRDGGENDGQVILYAGRLDLSLENQNLRSLLDGMHWRVMELEKVCSRMKTQMTKMKARRGGGRTARSLPRMCS